jgi:hypothetical protein
MFFVKSNFISNSLLYSCAATVVYIIASFVMIFVFGLLAPAAAYKRNQLMTLCSAIDGASWLKF